MIGMPDQPVAVDYRHEHKYILSDADITMMRTRMAGILDPDAHVGNGGGYLIRSIYFDDLYDRCMSENEDGTSPREKWRIRAYNCDRTNIFLECKRKECGLIHKDSCRISQEEYEGLIGIDVAGDDRQSDTDTVLGAATDRPVLNRFIQLIRTRGYTPKVIVEYMRYPYVYPAGNVRVTFDTDIASSPDISGFFDEDIYRRPVLTVGHQLMEVKFDELLPDHIRQTLSMKGLERVTFSKYYLCRRFHIGGI